MGMFVKVMAALLLTLPLGAYVAGTLVSSQVDMPAERAPVVVDGRLVSGSEDRPQSRTPRPSPRATPSSHVTPSRPDHHGGDDRRGDDRRDDDHSGHGRDGDDDIEVIVPTPRDLDDDAEDRAEDRAKDRAERREELAEEREDRAEELAKQREDDG